MKIAFITFKTDMKAMPIGILSLAAFLKKEFSHDIEIKHFGCSDPLDTFEVVKQFNPEVVGISFMSEYSHKAYEVADYFKKNTKIVVVLGGIHPTIRPEEGINHADYVVVGEGEHSFVKLIKCLSKKESYPEKIIFSEPVDDLSSSPPWDYSILNKDDFINHGDRLETFLGFKKNSKFILYLASRGCPYGCIYCFNSKKTFNVHYDSPEKIVDDIEYFIKSWKIDAVAFTDDDFLVNRPRFKKICELIEKKDLKFQWMCQASVDSVDLETLKWAKKHGCVSIAYGLETGSERMLKILKVNRVSVKDNRRAIKLAKKANIKVCGNFMAGMPTESIWDFLKTLYFMTVNPIDVIDFSITRAYPNTALYNYCIENKIFGAEEEKCWKFYLNNKYIPEKYFNILYKLSMAYLAFFKTNYKLSKGEILGIILTRLKLLK